MQKASWAVPVTHDARSAVGYRHRSMEPVDPAVPLAPVVPWNGERLNTDDSDLIRAFNELGTLRAACCCRACSVAAGRIPLCARLPLGVRHPGELRGAPRLASSNSSGLLVKGLIGLSDTLVARVERGLRSSSRGPRSGAVRSRRPPAQDFK